MASFLGEERAMERAGAAFDGTEQIDGEWAPLAALGVLKRISGHAEGVAIEPLLPASAFAALLPHAYCFGLTDRDRKRRMMEQYLLLSARLPVFEMRFQPGLQKLPEILDRIEQAIIQNARHLIGC
jgi:hypothetical protein